MASVPVSRALPLRESVMRAIAAALDDHPRRTLDVPDSARPAAVLLLLFERDDEPWIVLTKRTENVATHKGQISFPGGARDGDEDLWETAVRETHEELGVDPAAISQLGALDDHPTYGGGFVVAPFVAAIDPPDHWHPSEDEIDEVIEVPLRRLAEIGRAEPWEHDGIRFTMHLFDVDGHRVWGLTAFILRRFLDIVAPVLEVSR